MPMDNEPVQVPAQDDDLVTFLPEEDAPAPQPQGAVVQPGVDYDKFRGQGGDYIVNEEGHRVPLK